MITIWKLTDSKKILDVVEKYGGNAILTSTKHKNGTERIYEVSKNVSIPIIASGGFGEKKDLEKAYKAGADSIAVGHMLHYNKLNLRQIRDYALNTSIKVRKYAQ